MAAAPTLSICCATDDPPARVAAMLTPLRSVAKEIVVAVDVTVDEESIRDLYSVADKIVRYEFPSYVERALPWLHSLCSSDWILRLDGDEVVSPKLVDALPSLIESKEIQQYFIPTRRLWPTADRWLADWPWFPDFHNRLVRNNASLWFTGLCHSGIEPALPARYVDLPIYHLDAILNDERARQRKVARYLALPATERMRGADRLLAQFYLPEAFATEPPRRVPPSDRQAIKAVLEAVPTQTPTRRRRLPIVKRAEVERLWPRRRLPATAYRARVDLLDDRQPVEMTFREQRLVPVKVTNLGSEPWPGVDGRYPLIRMGVRWYRSDGEIYDERSRTSFSEPVAVGSSTIVPVFLEAPPEPGGFRVEIDVIHEFERWFDTGVAVDVSVVPPRTSLLLRP